MTDDDARQFLDVGAKELFDKSAWKSDLARATGYSIDAVNSWHRKGKRPPTIVLLWLEATLRKNAAESVLRGLSNSLRAVTEITKLVDDHDARP